MNYVFLDDPESYFQELGGIHDANIEQIVWEPIERTVSLCVDDLNSNFEGLPSYGGPVRSKFCFRDIEQIQLSCDAFSGDAQRIYKLAVFLERDSQRYSADLRISPGGRMSFTFRSVDMSVIDHDRPGVTGPAGPGSRPGSGSANGHF